MATLLDSLARRLPEPLRRPLRQLYAAVAARRSRPSLDDPEYEPELRRALEAVVESGWVCADVGAHHGIITAVLARLVGPTGLVVAFEAHPENAALLRSALAGRGLENRLRVENLAVTDGGSESVWLHGGRGRASTEWNVVGADVEGNPTPAELSIAAVSLDAYFERDARLDLVKIDVEGAEGQVLTGMRRLLREQRPALAVEFHHEAGWEGRRELLEAGYDLYALDGRRLDPGRDTRRLYHCLGFPQESDLPRRLAC